MKIEEIREKSVQELNEMVVDYSTQISLKMLLI